MPSPAWPWVQGTCFTAGDPGAGCTRHRHAKPCSYWMLHACMHAGLACSPLPSHSVCCRAGHRAPREAVVARGWCWQGTG